MAGYRIYEGHISHLGPGQSVKSKTRHEPQSQYLPVSTFLFCHNPIFERFLSNSNTVQIPDSVSELAHFYPPSAKSVFRTLEISLEKRGTRE